MSPCLFNSYAEYPVWNASLDETQAEIKIAGRNTSNLRYAAHTTLMVEIEEELKSLLMKMKEESEKAGLGLNFQITKIIALLQGTLKGKKCKQWQLLFSWDPKSLLMWL